MTLLLTLTESGHVANIEDYKSPGLARQAAAGYTAKGVVCRVVPDEMREDAEYLMGQIREQRQKGFVEEQGVVPNGRGKKSGARTFGRMIFPSFGGMLEGGGQPNETSAPSSSRELPLTLSSKSVKPDPKKLVEDDLIIRRT